MNDTVFTKIIKREIPATILWEDDESIAFLDREPLALGHTLLVSKEPYQWMTDTPDELTGSMFIKAKKFMKAIEKSLGCDYVEVLVMGKDVPHFHIHLIPRNLKDDARTWEHKQYDSDEEKASYAEKIKNSL